MDYSYRVSLGFGKGFKEEILSLRFLLFRGKIEKVSYTVR
jgi:hypothetical protein